MMISNMAELGVQRHITAALINADYEEITLIPREKIRTASGGFVWTELEPREPQRFHIIERVSNAMINNRVPGGEQVESEFTLLGNWDAEIAPGDIFTLNGRDWEVLELVRDNGYERRASVIRYG